MNFHLARSIGYSKHSSGHDQLRYYTAALALRPQSWAIHNDLGYVYRRLGNHEEALLSFRKAVQLKPDSTSSQTNLAAVLRDRGDLKGSIAACREAIRLNPKYARAHNNLASALYDSGDEVGALAAYREAMRVDPTHAEPHYNLGSIHLKKGQLDEAIAEYSEAIRLQKDHTQAHAYLGSGLEKKGRLNEAVSSYQKAIELGYDQPWIGYRLGKLLQIQGRPDEAISVLQEYLGKWKTNRGFLHHHIGRAREDKGQLQEAIIQYEQALTSDTTGGFDSWWQSETYFALARTLHKAKRFDTALTALNRAMDLRQGGHGSHWFLLAMLHWQSERKDVARQWFDKAAAWMDRKKPNDEQLRRLRVEAEQLLGIKSMPKDLKKGK